MNLSESYKKRLQELSDIKVIEESSIIVDELNSLPFKKDVESLGGKIYSVGGRVRDELIGKQSKDLDILITGIPIDRLEQILSKYGKAKEVGKSFGIIKFVPTGQKEEIDIAIPRTEKKIGTGYKGFEIKSDHKLPVESDLIRRDFTINSIAKDVYGNTVDPFGGREDLKNKIIRATSEQAFGEDPVRMLRAIQFAARFGFTIEPKTWEMIKKNASHIKEEPPERFITEFDKIIKKGNPAIGMKLLVDSGLFKEIFGFDYAGDNDFSKVKTMADLIYKLFENSDKVASSFYKHKLKGETNIENQIRALQFQEELSGNKVEDRKVVQKILNIAPNIENSGLLKDDTKAIIKTFKNGLYPLNEVDLDIKGGDLMKLGYKDSQIGQKKKQIMNAILSDEIPNKKEDILKFIEDLHIKENPKPEEESGDKNENSTQMDRPHGQNFYDNIYNIKEARNLVRKIIKEFK